MKKPLAQQMREAALLSLSVSPGGDRRPQAGGDALGYLFLHTENIQAIRELVAKGYRTDQDELPFIMEVLMARKSADLLSLFLLNVPPSVSYAALFSECSDHPWLAASVSGRFDLLDILWNHRPEKEQWLESLDSKSLENFMAGSEPFILPAMSWWCTRGIPLKGNATTMGAWLAFVGETSDNIFDLLQLIGKTEKPSPLVIKNLWEKVLGEDRADHMASMMACGWVPRQSLVFMFKKAFESKSVRCMESLLCLPSAGASLKKLEAMSDRDMEKFLSGVDGSLRSLQCMVLLHRAGLNWSKIQPKSHHVNVLSSFFCCAWKSNSRRSQDYLSLASTWLEVCVECYPSLWKGATRKALRKCPDWLRRPAQALLEGQRLEKSLPASTWPLEPSASKSRL